MQAAQGTWEDVFLKRMTDVFTRSDMYNIVYVAVCVDVIALRSFIMHEAMLSHTGK